MQVAYYRSAEMARLVEERTLREHYDLVYVHLIRMAEYARGLPVREALCDRFYGTRLALARAPDAQRLPRARPGPPS